MKIQARHLVAAALLYFAWKGFTIDMTWPPAGTDKAVVAPVPAPELLKWAEPLKPILPKMLPSDRAYLSNFYEAMGFVLLRDFDRPDPVIVSTDDFTVFHGGSLATAIDKAKVGVYPGLDAAIDKTLLAALGTDEPKSLTGEEKARLVAACGVLSHALRVGKNE